MPPRRSREPALAATPATVPRRDLCWWSAEPGARKKAEEEFRELPSDMQGQLLGVMERYLGEVSRPGDVKKLDRNIWEWRAHKGNNHYRVLFFTWGHVCVGLTAFYKNQQQTPSEDLRRANDRRNAWLDTRDQSPTRGWMES